LVCPYGLGAGLSLALGMDRPVRGVSRGCDVWDVLTPLPAFLERSPALQTLVSPQRRGLALLPWWISGVWVILHSLWAAGLG
jgi:hypothetical protein